MKSQAGFTHIALVLVLVLSAIIGVAVIQNKTDFLAKAAPLTKGKPTPKPSPTPTPAPSVGPRAFPDTSNGIFIFNDQISSTTDALYKFAATHYVGAQKMTVSIIRKIRSYNPNFIHLHYRLGQQLGYRTADSSCNLTGSYVQIIDGDNWVTEWPGDSVVQDEWFYKYDGQRVYSCWDHYLMEIDNPAWRQWWSTQVLGQLQRNEADGVFADSYSIPNYFGDIYRPHLPIVDSTFEATWAAKEKAFTDYIRSRFAGKYYWIPNIGSYTTTRDPSDYSGVDGGFIEGFVEGGAGRYYPDFDWKLQLNRILGLENKSKIMILQSYPDPANVNERMYILGSYLLIKGNKTYLNMEKGNIEWYPEYQINLGLATQPIPTQIDSFLDPSGLYKRNYQKGVVYVNPTSTSKTVNLGSTFYQAVPIGGGIVPSDGILPTTWKVNYTPVTSITLSPNQAAVLLNTAP